MWKGFKRVLSIFFKCKNLSVKRSILWDYLVKKAAQFVKGILVY